MPSILRSFFLGGFECSSHRRADGTRLDLLASSAHDRLAREDYEVLVQHGVRTVRDGVRWHLIEQTAGRYDWWSFTRMLRAAQVAGMQVIWDLCHYGWPDHLDVWTPQFVERFAAFARAAAQLVRDESDDVPVYCPINEISYWAWAGGEVGRMNPAAQGAGAELKRQLVRATLAAIDAIREVDRRARFIIAEPLIHVVSGSHDSAEHAAAENYRRAQFEVHDMLVGQLEPQLGGSPDHLDIVGVNFYPDNQWYLHGNTIPLGHHAYQPLEAMLHEVHQRYGRAILISETGAEGRARPYWLHHVCGEVRSALEQGVPVEGICLYPVLDYHGWDNGRICNVGLLSLPDESGHREVCPLLAAELSEQQAIFRELCRGSADEHDRIRYG